MTDDYSQHTQPPMQRIPSNFEGRQLPLPVLPNFLGLEKESSPPKAASTKDGNSDSAESVAKATNKATPADEKKDQTSKSNITSPPASATSVSALKTVPHYQQPSYNNDHSESQVLEALTRLRSSSVDPSKASSPISLSAQLSVNTSSPAANSTSVNTRITCFGLIKSASKTASSKDKDTDASEANEENVEKEEETATQDSAAASTSEPENFSKIEISKWGCGQQFDTIDGLQDHLMASLKSRAARRNCIEPFVIKNNYKNSNLKPKGIVQLAVENCLSSQETLATGDINGSFWSTVLENKRLQQLQLQEKDKENEEQSDSSIESPVAQNAGANGILSQQVSVTSDTSGNSANSSLGAKASSFSNISMSDLVQASLKVEADELKKKIKKTELKQDNKIAGKHKITKKEKVFLCSFCGKQFTRKSNLDSHLITHSSEKPHKCRECDKAFARLSDRTRHENTTHRTTKTFQCRGVKKDGLKEWGCGHFYSRADGLRKHFKSYAGKQCLYDYLRDLEGDTDELYATFRGKPSATTGNVFNNPINTSTFDNPEMLDKVESAIKNVRKHCGW